jgi:hypothetical protein
MQALLWLLIATVTIGGIWLILNRKRPTDSGSVAQDRTPQITQPRSSGTFHWEGTGDYEFEVVGESNYQDLLTSLAGEHGIESAEVRYLATLELEDDNPHDSKAVAVKIKNQTVAYLSRQDARSYRRRLGQKQMSGANATCDAVVVGGGTRRTGERLLYGVKLDIKPFE